VTGKHALFGAIDGTIVSANGRCAVIELSINRMRVQLPIGLLQAAFAGARIEALFHGQAVLLRSCCQPSAAPFRAGACHGGSWNARRRAIQLRIG